MASKCPKCDKTVYFAEKVSSLGKDWHKFCLKCERCNKTLTPGGHAEHDGKPYCHKPCYATLFGPKGVNIGGAGSYIYEKPQTEGQPAPGPIEHAAKVEEKKASAAPRAPSKASSITTFTGEPNTCPRCAKKVYFAEKVTSLGKDWHRPCLRCERCGKTLNPGGHAEVGLPRPECQPRLGNGGPPMPAPGNQKPGNDGQLWGGWGWGTGRQRSPGGPGLPSPASRWCCRLSHGQLHTQSCCSRASRVNGKGAGWVPCPLKRHRGPGSPRRAACQSFPGTIRTSNASCTSLTRKRH
uniref:Cysteine-rich protein 2 n=1 Tax=Varanus komodoensis TaxID=61221 RepID=A0A8D2IWT7_VARKO